MDEQIWSDQKEARENDRGVLQQLDKLFNVKLNNNPRKKLYIDESGRPFAE